MFLESRTIASEHIYVWIFPVSKEAAMLIIVKKIIEAAPGKTLKTPIRFFLKLHF